MACWIPAVFSACCMLNCISRVQLFATLWTAAPEGLLVLTLRGDSVMWWNEDGFPVDINQKSGELLICLGHQESPEARGWAQCSWHSKMPSGMGHGAIVWFSEQDWFCPRWVNPTLCKQKSRTLGDSEGIMLGHVGLGEKEFTTWRP